jgi:bifunctional enzyme Fae/Hps
MLDKRIRYLQVAFNGSVQQVYSLLPTIQENDRILIEAGTPFIKNEGLNGIRAIRSMWRGVIVADLKTTDGAVGEVQAVHSAGANGATALGSAPIETLNLFIQTAKELDMISMIDMIGVSEPLKKIRLLKFKPDVVILHKGRDEESDKTKMIEYKQINKIRSKYDVIIAAAGGVDIREARSAIFNGASLVVANIVSGSDGLTGIEAGPGLSEMVKQFLETIR